NIYFDMHVNSGAAVKLMQKTLNSLGNKVTITNKNDADTITAINTTDAPTLYNAYKKARIDYYNELVNKGTLDKSFLKGLLDRVSKAFPDLQGLLNSGVTAVKKKP